jgi:hypothetical protein
MRRFAWLCVVGGILIAVAGPFWAHAESGRLYRIWLDEGKTGDAARRLRLLESQVRMMQDGLRPAWTVVSPWPLVGVGAAVGAFGVIVLAIRRPERETP